MAGPRPPGSVVHLSYDGSGPVHPGDYLVTYTTGRTYLIDSVRVQERTWSTSSGGIHGARDAGDLLADVVTTGWGVK